MRAGERTHPSQRWEQGKRENTEFRVKERSISLKKRLLVNSWDRDRALPDTLGTWNVRRPGRKGAVGPEDSDRGRQG